MTFEFGGANSVQKEFQKYVVPNILPIGVTIFGLGLVAVLGFAPLMNQDTPEREAAASAQAAAAAVASASQTEIAELADRILALENMTNSRLSNIDNQVRNLNIAVGRINTKVANVGDPNADIAGLRADMRTVATQIEIMNKAITRMNIRGNEMKQTVETHEANMDQLVVLGQNLGDIFKSLDSSGN